MKRRNTIQIIVLLIVVLAMAIVIAYKMYTKPHRSVEDEKAIAITAAALFDAYEKDETSANTLYLNKVVEVTGKVSEVSTNMDNKKVVVLGTRSPVFGVRCTMQDSLIAVEAGVTITIKGICTGYLSDVVLTDGILISEYEN